MKPYTPPEHIDQALRAITLDWDGFNYSCHSSAADNAVFGCSIFFKCGLLSAAFKDTKIEFVQHVSAITDQCSQKFFEGQVKSTLQHLFRMDAAKVQKAVSELTTATKTLNDISDASMATLKNGSVDVENGWGAIFTARLDRGQGELRTGFVWFSSEAPVAK